MQVSRHSCWNMFDCKPHCSWRFFILLSIVSVNQMKTHTCTLPLFWGFLCLLHSRQQGTSEMAEKFLKYHFGRDKRTVLGEKLTPAEGNPTSNSVCSIPGVSSPDKIMSLLSQSLSETTQYWHCVSFASYAFICPQEITLEAFPFRGCHQISKRIESNLV